MPPRSVTPILRTLIALALSTAGLAHAATMYCCQDPNSGRRVCGDVLPDQCKNQGYRVLDGAGNVVREVGAPLTAQQRAEKEAEQKRKLEQETLLKEQRRKDSALLETYSNLGELDRAKERAESELMAGIKQAEEKVEVAQKRRKKFEDEAEFYKKREIPAELIRSLREIDNEVQAQKSVIASKQKDLETVRSKFEDDRRRFQEITGGGRAAMHPAAAR